MDAHARADMTTSSSSNATDAEKQQRSVLPVENCGGGPLDKQEDQDTGGGHMRGDGGEDGEENHGGHLSEDEDNDGYQDQGNGNGNGPSMADGVLSRVTSRSSVDPGPPPDRGWVAWSQCIIAHLVIFCTWGWANSFGSFQAYYAETLDRSPSDVSWIGSLNVFLLFFVGAFTGRLTDAGYFRAVFLVGSVLFAVGIFTTSLCTQYWQLLLAQGICMGIANGCLFCPILAVLSTYFLRRRAIALGIASCGTVSGGLVFPSMVHQLILSIGFPWTVRAIGFVQVGVLVAVNMVARTRVQPRRSGAFVDWSAFQELEYSFYALAAFFNFWGIYFAFFYIAAFSQDALHPGFSYPDSLNLLLIINGVGAIGRLIPNYAADGVGAVNIFIPTSLATSMLLFCFMAVKSAAGLYTWAVFAGIVSSGIQGLFPAALASLTTDLRKLGARIGMVFTIVSFAVLTGPPIAGAIIDGPTGYAGAQAFAGSSIAVGCGFLVAVKVVRMRRTGEDWSGRI